MLPATAFVVLTLLARLTLGSWAAPGAFFAIVWLFYVVVSLWLSPFESLDIGLWWMVLTVLFLYLGNLVVWGSSSRDRVAPPPAEGPQEPHFPHLPIVTLILLAAAVLYFVLSPVFVLPDPTTKPPRWFQFFLASVHALPMFAGLLYASSRRFTHQLIGLSSFPLGMILSAQQSSRSAMMLMVCFWLATYIPVNVMRDRGRFNILARERIPLAIVAGTMVVTSLCISTVSRQIEAYKIFAVDRAAGWQELFGELTPDSMLMSWQGLQSSTVGSVASFTWWFEREWNHPSWSVHYLVAMFSGPLEQLGLVQRELLAFETTYFSDETSSNVYTLFRPIIEAFTLPGSLVAVFCIGVITGLAYRAISRGAVGGIAILAVFMSNTMVSGGLWFGYNSIDVAFAALAIYVLYAGRAARRTPESLGEHHPYFDPTSRRQYRWQGGP